MLHDNVLYTAGATGVLLLRVGGEARAVHGV